MDAAEYKHVVLGVIFPKYISDAFDEKHAELVSQQSEGADPEDPDEYRAFNMTIDRTLKESSKANLRVMVKRVSRRYGYPPDKQEKATSTVLEQAELICDDWIGGQ